MAPDAEDFTAAMFKNYRDARVETGHSSPPLLRVLIEKGGVATAKELINANHASEGYKDLYSRSRLDLTVEGLVVASNHWHPLFTREEVEKARRRLRDYGYKPRSART